MTLKLTPKQIRSIPKKIPRFSKPPKRSPVQGVTVPREEQCKTALCGRRPPRTPPPPRRKPIRRLPPKERHPQEPFVMGDRRSEPFKMGTNRKERVAEIKRRAEEQKRRDEIAAAWGDRPRPRTRRTRHLGSALGL